MINTGAAAAAAFRQGTCYANGEFVQIHPTAIPGDDKLRLMSESARGEGGRIWTYKYGKTWYFLEEWNLARVITLGALARDESRGAHYKPDFPDRDDANGLKTTKAEYVPDGPRLTYEEVDASHHQTAAAALRYRTIHLIVKRQDSPAEPPYHEEFRVPYRPNMNVISALMAPGSIAGWGNSQNCVRACPKEIPLTTSLAKLTREVNRFALSRLLGG